MRCQTLGTVGASPSFEVRGGLSRICAPDFRRTRHLCQRARPRHRSPRPIVGLACRPPWAGFFPVGQRKARSLPERWPALSLAGRFIGLRFKAINSRTGEGQPGRCPFQIESDMDSKSHLVLLAALSLSCAMLALAMDHTIFGSLFSALSAVAVIGAAGLRARR